MYRCENEHIFEDPQRYHSYEDGNYPCCPYCRTDIIDEVAYCNACGAIFVTEDLTCGYCDKCANEILREFFRLTEEKFSNDERKMIDEKLNGDPIWEDAS